MRVNLKFTGKSTCQVARQNRKVQFILVLIVKFRHFIKKLFKMAKKMLEACPKIPQIWNACTRDARVGCCKNAT